MKTIIFAAAMALCSGVYAVDSERNPTAEELTGIFTGQIRSDTGKKESAIFAAFPDQKKPGTMLFYMERDNSLSAFSKLSDKNVSEVIRKLKAPNDFELKIRSSGAAVILMVDPGTLSAEKWPVHVISVDGKTALKIKFSSYEFGYFTRKRNLTGKDLDTAVALSGCKEYVLINPARYTKESCASPHYFQQIDYSGIIRAMDDNDIIVRSSGFRVSGSKTPVVIEGGKAKVPDNAEGFSLNVCSPAPVRFAKDCLSSEKMIWTTFRCEIVSLCLEK